ncbi:hypothetical protein PI124_g3685 [Phytophthora idaei]|nr:hypothetical protein PI125_g1185 [Phytophthora idaei]KAG3169126.1 hypothetical protein PI126_g2991 [Phytophthora idaei]KAG3251727.1 hypothetical protein PI124_g3685 [Phytophthora idaei]
MVGLREEFARGWGQGRRLFLGRGGSPGLLRLRPMESPATLRPALASASSASAEDRAQSTEGEGYITCGSATSIGIACAITCGSRPR